MPPLVAAQRLHDVVTRVGVDLTVATEVGDRGGPELERAEAASEVVLHVPVEELTGKDQQGVLQPCGVQFLPRHRVERFQIDLRDGRPERGVERFEMHRHSFAPGTLRPTPALPATGALRSGRDSFQNARRYRLISNGVTWDL